MADSSTAVDSATTLSKRFDDAWEQYCSIEDNNEPSNSEKFQKQIDELISTFENVTKMVSAFDVFSDNEVLEEVASLDIKYFLLPAILGDLTQKRATENRLEVLNTSEIYFKDFMRRCQSYQIISDSSDTKKQNDEPRSRANIVAQNIKREAKINKYKEKKMMEENLKELKLKLRDPLVDDEIVRKYYITLVRKWINQIYDELESLDMEKQILIEMAKRRTDSESEPKNRPSAQKPMKPVIITRNEMQKKIYGLGYPGIPTMSIEEFYEQKLKKNAPVEDTSSLMAKALAGMNQAEEREKEAIEKEEKENTDDNAVLKANHEWDEWKDDHRRGCGNRKNMG